MATQKQQGIKKRLTKGFVKVAIIGGCDCGSYWNRSTTDRSDAV